MGNRCDGLASRTLSHVIDCKSRLLRDEEQVVGDLQEGFMVGDDRELRATKDEVYGFVQGVYDG